ncbi:MAG: Cof-type HAD-IIB family hydrolase [Bacillus sp. (in: firmicutes)]
MAIKAIVLDIDGTLLNDKKQISPATKKALIDVQQNGIKVILASGRPTSGIVKYANELEMDKYDGLLVSYNGACVVNHSNDELLFSQPLAAEDSQAILEHLKNFDVKPMISNGDYLYVNNVYDCMLNVNNKPVNIIEYESRGGNFKLCEVDDLSAFVNFPLYKILVAADPDYFINHQQEIMQPFNGKLSGMFSAPMYFEFTDIGIDKANALHKTLNPLGISQKDIISFGDGLNDMSIIEYAGLGIAMGNAEDKLKNAANDITLTNNEDGIAFALAKYL